MKDDYYAGASPREIARSFEQASNNEEKSARESSKDDYYAGASPREIARSFEQASNREESLGSRYQRNCIGANDENSHKVQVCRNKKRLSQAFLENVVSPQNEIPPIVDHQTKDQKADEVLQKVFAVAKVKETKSSSVGTSEDVGSKAAAPNKYYEMAERLLEDYDFMLIDDQLYIYCEPKGFWKIIKESEANREIRNIIPYDMRGRVSKSSLYEVYEWLRILSRPPKVTDDVQKRKYYINFADQAYNWKSGDPKEERKGLFFRYALNLSRGSLGSKSDGTYAKFIKDVFGDDQETIREFRKFVGLCLSDIRNLKFCFFLYGPSNSGKTVMLNLLKRIVGEEWCSSLSFSQIGNEFAITQLLGKRLNLSGEVSGVTNNRLDIFKSLTGNDMITASFKGKDHFQFRNESLLVFACNNFPVISSLGEFDSFLSRIIIFPFFNVKPREEWIDNLEDLLLGDAYAIVKDAIKGLKALEHDSYSFKESSAMKECKQSFIRQYNSFALFVDEFIIQKPDGKITSDEIRDSYSLYCRERGYIEMPDNVWSRYLKQKFMCEAKVFEVLENGQKLRKRGYRGIQFIQREASQ